MHLIIIITNQIYFVSETDGTLISASEKLQALLYIYFLFFGNYYHFNLLYFVYCTNQPVFDLVGFVIGASACFYY